MAIPICNVEMLTSDIVVLKKKRNNLVQVIKKIKKNIYILLLEIYKLKIETTKLNQSLQDVLR